MYPPLRKISAYAQSPQNIGEITKVLRCGVKMVPEEKPNWTSKTQKWSSPSTLTFLDGPGLPFLNHHRYHFIRFNWTHFCKIWNENLKICMRKRDTDSRLRCLEKTIKGHQMGEKIYLPGIYGL
jgi:hypothetical protein